MDRQSSPPVSVENLAFLYQRERRLKRYYEGLASALPFPVDSFALHDVSFTVEPGEIVGLVGPNGGGKTTLFRLLLGTLRPASGTVSVFGLDPWAEGVAARLRIGYVAQEPRFPPHFNVGEVLDLHEQLYLSWNRDRAQELLNLLGLEGVFDPVASLSTGTRKALALVCAMAHDPSLLLLDEPSTGLDPTRRRSLFRLCAEAAARGCAVILASHLAGDIERLANRIVMLEGSVAFDGDLAALQESSCLALLPGSVGMDRVLEVPGCLWAGEEGELVEAVFLASPAVAERNLAPVSDGRESRCAPLPFEELLVRWCRGVRP